MRFRPVKTRRSAALAAIPLIGAGLATTVLPAQASGRTAVVGGGESWVVHSANLGHPSMGRVLGIRVYLAPRGGEAALEAAVAAVGTPGSASYRHFLSVQQYQALYEPSDAQVKDVSAFLRSNGIGVSGVEATHRYIAAQGTVSTLEQAFGTVLGTFRHSGQVVTAPTTAVSVPAALAADVLSVSGLDSTVAVASPKLLPPPPAFENGRPCSQFYGQLLANVQADYKTPLPKFQGQYRDYAICGYTPVQFRAAYEGATSLSGKGVTVAITDAYGSRTILKDANEYASINGDAPFAAGQYQQTIATPFSQVTACAGTSWEGEQTLDVEAVHGMAPNADVHYYGARSCQDSDLLDAINRVLDDNTASVITNSWGDLGEGVPTAEVAAYQQSFHQAAMQGISVLFSSGDNGDEVAATGIRQADFPASSPLVTAVGGTTTEIGPTGSLMAETGWGTVKYTLSPDGKSWLPVGFLYGSGGGFSTLFNEPSYQFGVVPTGATGRAVPDVAMDADVTTGMLIGETQAFPDGTNKFSEYRIGGTSLASPLFAGMTALTVEHNGGRLGQLNPEIYHQVAHHAGTFTDVHGFFNANVRVDYANGINAANGLVYSVRTFNQDSSLRTTPGWDDVTGVGNPSMSYLTGF